MIEPFSSKIGPDKFWHCSNISTLDRQISGSLHNVQAHVRQRNGPLVGSVERTVWEAYLWNVSNRTVRGGAVASFIAVLQASGMVWCKFYFYYYYFINSIWLPLSQSQSKELSYDSTIPKRPSKVGFKLGFHSNPCNITLIELIHHILNSGKWYFFAF